MPKILPAGTAMVNMLYSKYRRKAIKRGYDFLISLELFTSLIRSNCHYCGSLPMNSFEYDRDFLYNGVDRVDNDLGYVDGNVVTCCKWCNQAKSTMSYAQFVDYISRVYNHLKGD